MPDLSYKAKFWFIMLLPLCVGGLLGAIFCAIWAYKALVLGASKKEWFTHRPALTASTMALLYILYLYLTRTVFDVFNCTPRFPPDGRFYLSVANNEQCGVPGGTQVTLLPSAVAGLIVYSFGYPAFVLYVLYTNKEKAMLDQLLRAKGVGDDRLTNPIAFELRQTYGRSYFQFKPDFCFWILAIILRKFFISITAVVFGKNGAFQMAACLLVMFLAYSAQMMFRPYMSAGEYEDVLRSHAESAFSNVVHARLRSQIASIETRGKKRVRRNLLNFEGKVDRSAVLGILTGWLFNYNTIEQLMLFAAVIVCLMGIMYQANTTSTFYPGALDGVTAVVMITIISAIIYYVTVLVTEMVILYNESARTKQLQLAARNKGGDGLSKGGKGAAGPRGQGRLVDNEGELNVGQVEAQTNPLFTSGGGGGGGGMGGAMMGAMGGSADLISQTQGVPTLDLWTLFNFEYLEMQRALEAKNGQLADVRRELESAQAAGGDGGGVRRAAKKSFSPATVGGTSSAASKLRGGMSRSSE